MSEPIQAISQGNYILHNIDSKKLYVQEPLFTANSGDAVYVGWRPDETVLWSGNQIGSAFSITGSEPATNFQYIYILGHSNDNTPNQFNFLSDTHQLTITNSMQLSDYQFTTWGEKLMNLRVSRDCVITPEVTKERQWGSTAYTEMNTFGIYKVVGINRKENA